jgi:hypothetical protein
LVLLQASALMVHLLPLQQPLKVLLLAGEMDPPS